MKVQKGKGMKSPKWDAKADTMQALVKAHGNIKQKCLNPNDPQYKNYGKRGITLQADWATDRDLFVATVYAEVGPKPSPSHSLDRKDNNGNYASGNLQWTSKQDQAANRRSSAMITIAGKEVTRAEAAKAMGIPANTAAKQSARPRDPRVKEIEDIWLSKMGRLGKIPMSFSYPQRRLVSDMLNRLQVAVEWKYPIGICLNFWDEFAEVAVEAAGLRRYPEEPTLEFFVAQIAVAIPFSQKKWAALKTADEARERARRRQEGDEEYGKRSREAMERGELYDRSA